MKNKEENVFLLLFARVLALALVTTIVIFAFTSSQAPEFIGEIIGRIANGINSTLN